MAMFGGSDTATTDASGSFTFERVPPGQWTVNASPGEREMFKTFEGARDESAFFELMAQNLSQQVDVEDGGQVFVELGAEPREPVIVMGEVTRGGTAVSGGNVTFAREGGDLFANLKRADIEAGAYRIELDRPGAYLVSVERGSRRNGFLIDVPASGEQRVNLELPEGGIAGRVTDSDGRPAAGIRVTAEPSTSFSFNRFDPRSASTDADGRYELGDLDPGTYALRVGSRGWGRGSGSTGDAFGVALVEGVEVNATSMTAGVDVQLSSPGRVIGVVVGRDGAPVAGATVFVRESSGRPVDAISTVRSGADGRFAYSRVNPGSYVVSARGDGQASEGVAGVLVSSGKDTEVRLEVDAASDLVIRTVEEDDTPVRAEVTVLDSEGREVSGLVGTELFRSFGEGVSTTEQRFGPLAPGRYTITATAQDGRTERKRVTVKASRDTRTRLRFEPAGE
jgi:protocatechuate 3,4-dioxygenase beta subunit